MSDRTTVPLFPPRLKARLDFFNAKLPKFYPAFDRCFVYSLKGKGNDQPDTTAGGIVLPTFTKEKLTAQRGLLIMAGAQALEQLYSHGIGIGDIVVTARFSPWFMDYMVDGTRHEVHILNASDITASEDLCTRIDAGDLWMEMDKETNLIQWCDRENNRPRNDPPEADYGV